MTGRQDEVAVELQRLAHGAGLELPCYQTDGSAGMDLRAAIDRPWRLESLERRAVPTGIAIALPPGLEGQVRPRSGLALETGLSVANAPGTIDSDYRGEIKVIAVNLALESIRIEPGQRIAQLVIAPVRRARWREVDLLDDSPRGSGGFGHTGR